jgi:acyl-CoA thioester hydrolase
MGALSGISDAEMIDASVIIKIPFYDVDVMSMVWHGHYVKYFEQARAALLDKIDYNYPQMLDSGYIWPVIDMRIKYIKPIRIGSSIKVQATLAEYENRLKIEYLVTAMLTRISRLLLCAGLMHVAAATAAPTAIAFDYATAAREPDAATLAAIGRLQQVALIHGAFRQQKNLKILKRPFLSGGRFVFSKQDGLYWEIVEPLPGAYLINKKGMRPAAAGTAVESPFADSIGRLFSSVLGADLKALQDHFDIYYRNADGRWQIGLKPGNRHIGAFISSIEITGNQYIDAIRIVETGGDTTDIAFSAVAEGLPAGAEAQYFK